MTRRHCTLAAASILTVALTACSTVPYTGRSRLPVIMSQDQENRLGEQLYQKEKEERQKSSDPEARAMVSEVGRRIAAAADRPTWQWEFTLFEDEQENAWCLPGGKVGIYSGLFPVAKYEAGLASVIGHEVAHAVLRHGAERSSKGLLANLIGAALMVGVNAANASPETIKTLGQVYGLGAAYGVLLPYSRLHESEADEVGLILMAKAGYNPEAAIGVWNRMAEASSEQPPEFLSTHPTHGTRISRIREALPEALRYYEGDEGEGRLLPGVSE